MITYTCSRCQKALEVDDELAGQRVACPHCGDIKVVPAKSAPEALPVARPAGSTGGVSGSSAGSPKANTGSLEALGLPSHAGPEETIRTLHPAMFRAKPFQGLLIVLMIAGGAIGAVVLHFMHKPDWMAAGAAIVSIAGVIWLGVWKVKTMTVALTITNKRTILRKGLLGRSTDEMLHDRIQDIQITQTFAQRMWKIGSLELASAGDAGGVIEVSDIHDPDGLRAIIDAYRDR